MSGEPEQTMPESITRPLFGAFWAFLILMAGVVVWAMFAPLSTTIHANGNLTSATPRYEIQHPFGGVIAQVGSHLQNEVSAGDVLYRLDVSVQKQRLEHVKEQISQLEAENAVLRDLLDLPQNGRAEVRLDIEEEVARRFEEMNRQLVLDVAAVQAQAENADVQSQKLSVGLAILNTRREKLLERSDSMAVLVKKGVLAAAETQGQVDLLLSVKAQINEKEIELLSLGERALQAKLTSDNLKTKYKVSLHTQLKANEARLPQLRQQVLALGAEVSNAEILSPIDGVVVDQPFNTRGMYVPRGVTLATLSHPLTDPSVSFNIPTQAIDQVHLGMVGVLAIPSLPQRNLPKIHVELVSISPEAAKNKEGKALGYPAKARILAGDLSKIRAALDQELRLATDMPVSLSIEGRKTTFSHYLVAPFFTMFKGGLQD